jgi:endonuclease/exonuclease/phosphatase family metal-dependent hydrolase
VRPVRLAILLVAAATSLAACPGPAARPHAPVAARRTQRPAPHPRRPHERPPAVRPPARLLHLASWNLKRLGHGKKRLDLVARVIRQQDVVALEEVMTPDGVGELLRLLPGWAALVSPAPVGRGGYAEHYAVLYRKDAVRPLDSFTVDDPRDEFAREPFVACLASGAFDFCVVVIHVVFGGTVGPRDAEIAALGPLLDRLAARSRERDWLVIGDFNRPASARSFASLLARGFTMASGARVMPTSIARGGYRSDYDHLLLHPGRTREWRSDCVRIDIVTDDYGGDYATCARDLSDHAPIRATFDAGGPDDD